MGVSLQEQGKLDEAIEAYNKALSIKPDYAEASTAWAMLSKSKEANEAIKAYNKALSIKPYYAEAWNNLFFALQTRKIRAGLIKTLVYFIRKISPRM